MENYKMHIASIANNPELTNYIECNISDPWEDTPYEGYVHMNPKQKGEYGERFVQKICEKMDLNVERAPTSTNGYDRIINGIKTEIKFSLAQKDKKNDSIKSNTFMINHVSEKKDWERLIFLGINPNNTEPLLFWLSKDDFQKHIISEVCCFSRQQGGKDGENDDYMCSAAKVMKFSELPFIKSGLDEW